jgi:ribokinase
VSVDLAVATPAFLDLTFVGLEALPGPGEERFAGDLLRTPGGGAITAVGAVRLGLTAAVAAPLGEDPAGDFVRTMLTEEGVAVGPARGARTATTVVLPVGAERSMVTVDPGIRARREDVAALAPRAVGVNLELLDLVPPGARAYVTCGDDDARAFALRPPRALAGARLLTVNRRESLVLTGASQPEDAVEELARLAEIAVVTLGHEGAIAVADGRRLAVPGEDTGRVVDSTGAGDLLAAAFAWGDLQGADPEVVLRWANLYAALSVTAPTGVGGAATLDRLLEEGRRRGLPAVSASVTSPAPGGER